MEALRRDFRTAPVSEQDRVMLEGYLGLIPDASTLRVVFADGTVWAGPALVARISSRLSEVAPAKDSAG